MTLRIRRSMRLVAVACSILIATELILQVFAYLAYREAHHWYPFRGDQAKRRVVCLGDGLTLGVGASTADASYPAQLQSMLGEGWSVHNAGALGLDSGEALLRLSELLAEDRPEVVCLAVGRVDTQMRPIQVRALRVAQAFEWRFQILQLLRSDPVEPDALAFVGDWNFGTLLFRFAEDGSVVIGGVTGTWTYEDSELMVHVAGGESIAVSWSLEGEDLHLAGNFPGGRVIVSAGPPSTGGEREIESLLRREDLLEAAWSCDVILRGAKPTPEARALRVEVAWLTGDRKRAADEFETLVKILDGVDPNRLVARCKLTMGDSDAEQELVEFCRDHPEASLVADDLRWRAGEHADFVDASITEDHMSRIAGLCADAGVRLVLVPAPNELSYRDGTAMLRGAELLWRDPETHSVAGYGSDLGYRRLAELLAAEIEPQK